MKILIVARLDGEYGSVSTVLDIPDEDFLDLEGNISETKKKTICDKAAKLWARNQVLWEWEEAE